MAASCPGMCRPCGPSDPAAHPSPWPICPHSPSVPMAHPSPWPFRPHGPTDPAAHPSPWPIHSPGLSDPTAHSSPQPIQPHGPSNPTAHPSPWPICPHGPSVPMAHPSLWPIRPRGPFILQRQTCWRCKRGEASGWPQSLQYRDRLKHEHRRGRMAARASVRLARSSSPALCPRGAWKQRTSCSHSTPST